MGVEIPVGYGEASLQWRLTGDAENMVTTLGFSAGGTARADLEAAAQDLSDQWFAEGLVDAADMYVGWTFVGIEFHMNTSDAGEIVMATSFNEDGTVVGETPPINVAILVHKRSALGGRKNRGRMYLPPANTAESAISKLGALDSTNINNRDASMAAFLTAFEAATVGNELVILHSDPLDTPTPISSFSTDPIVATQRRRLR